MPLIRDKKRAYRSSIESAVGNAATAKDVLDHLFGRYSDEDPAVDFVIYEWRKDGRTPLQRLNMFWAIPLTLICAPYQYAARGEIGWDSKSKFGCWILKVTGHLYDA